MQLDARNIQKRRLLTQLNVDGTYEEYTAL